MKILVGILAVLLLGGCQASHASQAVRQTALSNVSTEALIDQLATLDQETADIASGGDYEVFMAEDKPPQFIMGMLPVKPVIVPPQMRELVQRGGAALPVLIAHLRDTRPTGIVVGDGPLTFRGFKNEYEGRSGPLWRRDTCGRGCREFITYRVTVGDICEVLIGQIVGRRLIAVRYQPTGNLFVNSPVQTPELARRIEADWKGVDGTNLEAALFSDLDRKVRLSGEVVEQGVSWTDRAEMSVEVTRRRHYGALRRLRFYYPETYAGLEGKRRVEREAFEAAEREDDARLQEEMKAREARK